VSAADRLADDARRVELEAELAALLAALRSLAGEGEGAEGSRAGDQAGGRVPVEGGAPVTAAGE
jgi:hypothetical protein